MYGRRLLRSAPPPAHVWVASVAAPRVNRALARAARRAGVPVTFVAVPRRGGGVRVAYPEPWRLGVDRFVAAVGAHELIPHAPLCVVGVGTALTVDLIGADGRHRGGVIVPGPALMVETLFDRTHGIHRRAQGGSKPRRGRGLFARSTRAGVMQGARYAAAGLIDRAVEEGAKLLGRRPLVVLSGGGATHVRPLLKSRCRHAPNLVLRGLATLTQAKARSAPDRSRRTRRHQKPRIARQPS